MTHVNPCPLCDQPLDVSSEHIIPQAIGGRKGVTGFICNACNNDTGSKWDSQVVDRLGFIANILQYKRPDGKSPQPVEVFSEDLQTEVMWDGKGNYYLRPQVERKERDGQSIGMKVSGSDERQLKRIIESALAKHDTKSQSPDQILADADRRTIVNPTLRISLDLNLNLPIEQSATKSAIALAFSAGIEPSQCDIGLSHLKAGDMSEFIQTVNDDTFRKTLGVAYFFTQGQEKLWSMNHTVHITAAGNHLMGYVEYAGIWRILMILSEKYQGEFIFAGYDVDPSRAVDEYYCWHL